MYSRNCDNVDGGFPVFLYTVKPSENILLLFLVILLIRSYGGFVVDSCQGFLMLTDDVKATHTLQLSVSLRRSTVSSLLLSRPGSLSCITTDKLSTLVRVNCDEGLETRVPPN